MLYITSNWSVKLEFLFLAFIAVDPHFQGQGLGRYLLRGLDDLVESSNQASGLAVFVTRSEQREFFSSEGFDVFKALSFNQVEGDLMFKAANWQKDVLEIAMWDKSHIAVRFISLMPLNLYL